jgi:hypothetical protein
VTDALAAILRNVRIDTLAGQAHEGMTTAPQLYAEATMRFLLVEAEAANAQPLTFVPPRWRGVEWST